MDTPHQEHDRSVDVGGQSVAGIGNKKPIRPNRGLPTQPEIKPTLLFEEPDLSINLTVILLIYHVKLKVPPFNKYFILCCSKICSLFSPQTEKRAHLGLDADVFGNE